jgi:hypothetical protein
VDPIILSDNMLFVNTVLNANAIFKIIEPLTQNLPLCVTKVLTAIPPIALFFIMMLFRPVLPNIIFLVLSSLTVPRNLFYEMLLLFFFSLVYLIRMVLFLSTNIKNVFLLTWTKNSTTYLPLKLLFILLFILLKNLINSSSDG